MAGNEQALSAVPPASIQVQPTPADTTPEGVQLEIHSAEVHDAAAHPGTAAGTHPAHTADPQQRTWWEWVVTNVNSLGESLNPSYEFGKRAPPPAPTLPQGAVAVAMPRTLSGAAAERQKAASRNKTALLLRAFEGHPPSGQPPSETPTAT